MKQKAIKVGEGYKGKFFSKVFRIATLIFFIPTKYGGYKLEEIFQKYATQKNFSKLTAGRPICVQKIPIFGSLSTLK